jgi:uncharacterized LabA/DUF88 family protein
MDKKRVIFYIDGYNLYYGMRECGWKKYYWLDLDALCSNILRACPHRELTAVKYFTARINQPPDSVRRQSLYLEAVETLPKVTIIYGQYYTNVHGSQVCFKEKRTDVNIAVNLIFDALDDLYDVAYLVSGDSDLVPAVEKIRAYFPKKWIIACFPPKRISMALKKACHGNMQIYEGHLKGSQFPPKLQNKYNYMIERPITWA